MGKYWEADMLLKNRRALRAAIRDPNKRWPTNHIPFKLELSKFRDHEIEKIYSAIREINEVTCAKFRNATERDIDYVLIVAEGDGCASAVGKKGGQQLLKLEPPVCLARKGTILHELLHTVGLVHEHNSPLRDDYVTIMKENIKPGKEEYFEKLLASDGTDFGYDYDYNSIMHGSKQWLSKNGSYTIEPHDGTVVIGNKQKLSRIDVLKVGKLLNCKE